MARILFVDDDKGLLEKMPVYLRENGHSCTVTDNGKDALALIALAGHFDIMILDLIMPGMDGNAVIRALRDSAPDVIVHTADPSILTDYIGTKVKRVLRKPYDPPVLLKAIDSVVKGLPEGDGSL